MEGIVKWWLRAPRVEPALAVIETALARLVRAGKLQTKTGPDGQVHYLLGRPVINTKRITRVRRQEQNSDERPKRPRAAA